MLESYVQTPLRNLGAFLILAVIGGCVAIPTPPIGNIDVETLDSMKSVTLTREKILDELGDPDDIIADGRFYIYHGQSADMAVLWILLVPPYLGGYGNVVENIYRVLIEFDDNGAVKRHEILVTDYQGGFDDAWSQQKLPRRTLIGSYYKSVAFSPDGKTLAAGGTFKSSTKPAALLWRRPEYGAPVGLPPEPSFLTELSSGLQCGELTFSPSGNRLAGRCNQLIEIWDVHSGKQLHSLKGGGNPFSAEGSLIL